MNNKKYRKKNVVYFEVLEGAVHYINKAVVVDVTPLYYMIKMDSSDLIYTIHGDYLFDSYRDALEYQRSEMEKLQSNNDEMGLRRRKYEYRHAYTGADKEESRLYAKMLVHTQLNKMMSYLNFFKNGVNQCNTFKDYFTFFSQNAQYLTEMNKHIEDSCLNSKLNKLLEVNN